MATLFVDKVDPQSGTNLEIGSSGDTIALGSGATQTIAVNTPSFSANKISGSISFSLNTWSKMSFDNELYDTSSAYDTSNYRFTVPSGQAGKYHFTGHFNSYEQSNSNISSWNTGFYKNGSLEVYLVQSESANHGSYRRNMISADLDLAVGDYIELYARLNATAGTARVEVGNVFTRFSGFKLIG